MKQSMKARLYLILLVTTGLIWLSAVVWIFVSTRSEVEAVLDSRLVEAANMVSSLVDKQDLDAARAANAVTQPVSYERQLSCQIWSFEGNLLSRSDGAPNGELTRVRAGFSQTDIDGERWRVYAVENKALGIRVLIGDNIHTRDDLVNDVIKGLLLPALLMIPALAVLIWMGVGTGLAPLHKMAALLSARTASDLTPMPDVEATKETVPLVHALNSLLSRVAATRERERNFAAFAAHELRTPLAGLKTQAQVAIASDDPKVREKALQRIVEGASRTGRLVRQLMDLASVEAADTLGETLPFVPGDLLVVLRDELVTQASQKRIVIAPALFKVKFDVNADLFALAARNLLENALLHSMEAVVICDIVGSAQTVVVKFDDNGPGIPADEIDHVTERFFRGRNKAAVGSGLGLSIAQLAVERAGMSLNLTNRHPNGLSVAIILSADQVHRLEDRSCLTAETMHQKPTD